MFCVQCCVHIFSDHGRRRVLLMAILPHTPEKIDVFRHVYDGLHQLMLHSIPDVSKTFHSDFKAIAIAIGNLNNYLIICACMLPIECLWYQNDLQ